MLGVLLQLRELHPHQRLVFLPTTESIIRLVLENREAFETAGLEVPLVDKTLYETISDKSTFLTLMENFGVPLPPQIKQVGPNDLPVVAKPLYEVSRSTGRKVYPELIFTAEALKSFLASEVAEDCFFQTYLDGRSYYFLAFFPRKGAPTIRYQENLLQQPNGKSMLGACLCDCPDLKIEVRLVRGFQSVGFFGFVMVELIEVNGVLHLIEANPRFWGPFELAIKAGFRPDAIVNEMPFGEGDCRALYLWMGGLLLSLASGGRPRCYPQFLRKLLAHPIALFRAEVYLRVDTLRLLIHEIRGALGMACYRIKKNFRR